jgi:hypothetical protein
MATTTSFFANLMGDENIVNYINDNGHNEVDGSGNLGHNKVDSGKDDGRNDRDYNQQDAGQKHNGTM